MGFANKHLDKLRKIGRKFVLPSDEIKDILESHINFNKIKTIVDFGAGSLFWSEYFAQKLADNRANYAIGGGQNMIFAIDAIYESYRPKYTFDNVILGTNILSALKSQTFDLIFASDVFHHLDSVNLDKIFGAFCAHGVKFIVVKDIDANYKFGNFMNKAHDLLINGEKVRSIFPQTLQTRLESSGFSVEYFYLSKLWYPHFLLIAQRKI